MADKQIAFGLSPPENAVAHGLQEGEHSEEKLYSIIAISDQFGEIPGKCHEGDYKMSYYCCEGQEFQEPNFYWVVSDRPTSLVHVTESPEAPSNAIKLGFEKDLENGDEIPTYSVIANTERGKIPGKVFGDGSNIAWVPIDGETATEDFYWIVVEEE